MIVLSFYLSGRDKRTEIKRSCGPDGRPGRKMKQATYMKQFNDENKALDWCEMKNKACKRAKSFRDIFAVVDGPENDYAVVDVSTAIGLGFGYKIIG